MDARRYAFIDAYLETGNGTAAAVEAGYSPRSARTTAYRLLTNADIRAEVDARRAEAARKAKLDRDKVIAGLLEAIQIAKISGQPMAMVAGWREVGKLLGFYEPERLKIEISPEMDREARRLAELPRERLLALVTEH